MLDGEYQCAECGRRFLWETGLTTCCPHCRSPYTVPVVEEEDDDG